EVAAVAGVSKALVFHYFPTKRDLQVAILRAATSELVSRLDPDPSLPRDERLRAGLEVFVAYIEQHPASYLAMARGAGSDERLLRVFEDTRAAVVEIIVGALDLPEPPPGLRLALRGWIAMVEETVLHWLESRPVPRPQLVSFLQQVALTMLPSALSLSAEER
ncbi:MAG TPA: TetR/AcrR family transcriptional regulator, partial [Acidimicrobiales bacterium]|nr:TetR/AcrR family transcriptional regulator [Acidimicrobiales bacterium]